MGDQSVFEEPLLNDPSEKEISLLSSVYRKVVTKKVQDLLRDLTLFHMAASVSIQPYLCCLLPFFVFDIACNASKNTLEFL